MFGRVINTLLSSKINKPNMAKANLMVALTLFRMGLFGAAHG